VNTQTVNTSAKPQRRWDVDWLRMLAVLLLFLFHPARIFDTGRIGFPPWYITNDQLSNGLTYLMGLMNPWHMPLFFLLAGSSTWLALRFRSGNQYVKERFKRLLIPWIFGVLVIAPPQMYFMLRNHDPTYVESFPQSYLHSLVLAIGDMGGHLWFIFYLFVFSLIALPLFLYLNGESGKRLVDRLAGFFARRGMIFLLAIPIIVMDYVLLRFYPNPLYFITFFIYGYILMADARFGEAIDRHKTIALILGPVIYVVWLSLGLGLHIISTPEAVRPFMNVYFGFVGWSSLIALLGYGKQFLSFTNKLLKYGIGASYPYYIIHQTAIIAIGFSVVQWNAGVLVKYVTIVVASFVATAILYEVVKRINVTRFLLGMRPLR